MTVQEAINLVREYQPNQYDDASFLRWLSDLDGMVWHNIVKLRKDAPEAPGRYTAQDMGAELLIAFPYEDVYVKYLCAQIDFHNAEWSRYNNEMAAYNAILQEYANRYGREHGIARVNPIRLWG